MIYREAVDYKVAPGLDETGGERKDMSLTSISDCKMYLRVGCFRIPALSSKAALR